MPAYPTQPHPETDCEKIRPLLSSLADGATTPDEAARAEAHMAVCADCTSYLAFLRTTSFVFQRSMETPSLQLFDRIAQATYNAPKVPTWRERVAAWFNPAPTRLALGTALAAAIVGALIVPHSSELNDGPKATRDRMAANPIPSPAGPASSAANTVSGTSVPGANGSKPGTDSSLSHSFQLREAGFSVASIWGRQKAQAARPASVTHPTGDNTSVRSRTSSSSAAESVAKTSVSPATNGFPPASAPSRNTEPSVAPHLAVTTTAPEVERHTRTADVIPSSPPAAPSVTIAEPPVIPRTQPSIAAAVSKGPGRVEQPTTTAAADTTPSKLFRPEPKSSPGGFTLAGAKTAQPKNSWSVEAKGLGNGHPLQTSMLPFVGAPTGN